MWWINIFQFLCKWFNVWWWFGWFILISCCEVNKNTSFKKYNTVECRWLSQLKSNKKVKVKIKEPLTLKAVRNSRKKKEMYFSIKMWQEKFCFHAVIIFYPLRHGSSSTNYEIVSFQYWKKKYVPKFIDNIWYFKSQLFSHTCTTQMVVRHMKCKGREFKSFLGFPSGKLRSKPVSYTHLTLPTILLV